MPARGSQHGMAMVTPLPRGASKNAPDPTTKKKALKNDSEADGMSPEADVADNLPLLETDSSSHEEAKTTATTFVVSGAEEASAYGGLRRAKGLGFIVFAAFNFSIVAACVKFASHRLSSHETVFWRMVVALVMNFAWVIYKKRSLAVEAKHRGMLVLRCCMGTICVSLQFYAMSQMVLTDAVVIIFTSPVFTFFLGAVVLGEAIDRVDVIGGVASFVGVLFVTRPAFLFSQRTRADEAPLLAVLAAIGASVTQAIVYITIRKMQGVDNLVVINYFLLIGTSLSVISLWYFQVHLEVPMEAAFLFAIIGSGFFSYVGQIFLTLGFQTEKAGIASVMRYFDVVFVMCWDTMLLGEHVNVYSILGAATIMGGASLIVLHRAKK